MGRTIVTARDVYENTAADYNIGEARGTQVATITEEVQAKHLTISEQEQFLRQLLEKAEEEGVMERVDILRKVLRASEEQSAERPDLEAPSEDTEGSPPVEEQGGVIERSSPSTGVDGYLDRLLKYIP